MTWGWRKVTDRERMSLCSSLGSADFNIWICFTSGYIDIVNIVHNSCSILAFIGCCNWIFLLTAALITNRQPTTDNPCNQPSDKQRSRPDSDTTQKRHKDKRDTEILDCLVAQTRGNLQQLLSTVSCDLLTTGQCVTPSKFVSCNYQLHPQGALVHPLLWYISCKILLRSNLKLWLMSGR